MSGIEVSINGRILESTIHPFNLTVRPVIEASEPMFNAIGLANPVKDVLKGILVVLKIGELNAIIGENRVDTIGNCCNQVA